MTVRTVTNLPAVTHGETVRCLFAIELSTMSWVVAFNTPLSEKISRHALTGCKWKRLLELIEEVRARVSRETGRAVEVVSCYEAGYDGFWLHRKLEAHGIRNYVIDPASLQVDRRVRRVKTDRIDTERLLRSLMAYLRGEPAPSPFQSGNVAHDQGISKAGNRKGRTTGIELAWLWLRYQPDSDLSVWFRARVGTVKGRIRRIAIVALARKLLVALWRYLETGLVPRGAVLKG